LEVFFRMAVAFLCLPQEIVNAEYQAYATVIIYDCTEATCDYQRNALRLPGEFGIVDAIFVSFMRLIC